MKASGYLIVVVCYIAVALAAYAICRAVHVDNSSLSLILAALAGTSLGVAIWHRQSPASPLWHVKLGLGLTLAITAAALSLVLQKTAGWERYPAVAIPVDAAGCFAYPFIAVGRIWTAMAGKDGKKDGKPDAP